MISYTDFVWDGPNLRLYSTRGRIVATMFPTVSGLTCGGSRSGPGSPTWLT